MVRTAFMIGLMATLLVGCGRGRDLDRGGAIAGPPVATAPGRNFDQRAIAALPVGLPKAEIHREFGAPHRAIIDEDGYEIWTYAYTTRGFQFSERPPPAGMTEGKLPKGVEPGRVTQAPELTTLDHQESTIKMGPPYSKRASLRFRDGKLVKVDVVITPQNFFAEQRATLDANGNVTVTLDADGNVTFTLPK